MFNSKQKQLFESGSQVTSDNAFVKTATKNAAITQSGNGAMKYSETNNDFVNQFTNLGNYKAPRSYEDVSRDMSVLWAKNPLMTMMFVLFIRMITRITSIFEYKTATVQRGAGLRHEGILRMMWIHINHKDTFWKNIHLFVSVGSWKDIIQMLSLDLQYNGWKGRMLDWNSFGKLILAGLENPSTSNLVKKYLPQIKANSKCKTLESQADNLIAKWICSLLFGSKESAANYKKYRKLKTSGNAHQWQQLISQGKHSLVNFDTVHGRALAIMVSGKYLENQGLTKKYEEWIASKPVAKFTGYVHELFKTVPTKKHQIDTLNKQFMGLVETASKGANKSTSMIVVRDTSGSMDSIANGTTQSSNAIARALALFFSYMLPEGAFANSWIEFNDYARMHQWKGSTPYEKWQNDRTSVAGGTDFQSAIDLFVEIKSQGVTEDQFPSGIICISDFEFDPSELGKTNVETALDKLRNAGFSSEYVNNFKIVLWNIPNTFYRSDRSVKFETFEATVPNVFYFSGYDPSTVAFLTGIEGSNTEKPAPKNASELFDAAMDQEIMKMIEI